MGSQCRAQMGFILGQKLAERGIDGFFVFQEKTLGRMNRRCRAREPNKAVAVQSRERGSNKIQKKATNANHYNITHDTCRRPPWTLAASAVGTHRILCCIFRSGWKRIDDGNRLEGIWFVICSPIARDDAVIAVLSTLRSKHNQRRLLHKFHC